MVCRMSPSDAPKPDSTTPSTAIADGAQRAVIALAACSYAARAFVRVAAMIVRASSGRPGDVYYSATSSTLVFASWSDATATARALLPLAAAVAAFAAMRRATARLVYPSAAMLGCLVLAALGGWARIYERISFDPQLTRSASASLAPDLSRGGTMDLLFAAALLLALYLRADGRVDRLRSRDALIAISVVTLDGLAQFLRPPASSADSLVWLDALFAIAAIVTVRRAIALLDLEPPPPADNDSDAGIRAARGMRRSFWAFAVRVGFAFAIAMYVRSNHIARAEERLLEWSALCVSVATDVIAIVGFLRATSIPRTSRARSLAAFAAGALCFALAGDLHTYMTLIARGGFGVEMAFSYASIGLVAAMAWFAAALREAFGERGDLAKRRWAAWSARLLSLCALAGFTAAWAFGPRSNIEAVRAYCALVGGASGLLGLMFLVHTARRAPAMIQQP